MPPNQRKWDAPHPYGQFAKIRLVPYACEHNCGVAQANHQSLRNIAFGESCWTGNWAAIAQTAEADWRVHAESQG